MPESTGLVIRSSFSQTLNDFEQELRRRLIEGVRMGQSMPEIERLFAETLRDLDMPEQMRRALTRELRRSQRATAGELRAEFILERTIADRASIRKLVSTTLEQFTRFESNIERRILSEIERGIASGRLRFRPASRAHSRSARARTIARTGLAGVSRAAHIETAREAGVDSFRYDGSSPQREFCREHHRKVYTLEEIDQLNNGQGLPVRTHCGGYNCTHRWRAVVTRPIIVS